jgi:hypothetical protein
MSTYDKYILNLGNYQEGNVADIELDMDDNFPMDGVKVTFEVRDMAGRLVIQKRSNPGDGITITGQNILITLLSADTRRRAGKYDYEIDFLNLASDPFATIGGSFTISREVNQS